MNGDSDETQTRNFTPSVGILANELFEGRRVVYVDDFVSASEQSSCGSWIGNENISFLEMGGAQVVPISLYQSQPFYKHVFENINGLYIPVDIFSDELSRIIDYFMQWSKEAAAQGDRFPIWGPFWTLTKLWPKIFCNNLMGSDSVVITKGTNWDESKFVQSLSEDMKLQIQQKYCTQGDNSVFRRLTEKGYYASELGRVFKYAFGMVGKNNEKYVTLLENDKLGWYQLNFHPEKSSHLQDNEIDTDLSDRFSIECVNFLIDQTRKNLHRLKDLSLLINKEKRTGVTETNVFCQVTLEEYWDQCASTPHDKWYSSLFILKHDLDFTKEIISE